MVAACQTCVSDPTAAKRGPRVPRVIPYRGATWCAHARWMKDHVHADMEPVIAPHWERLREAIYMNHSKKDIRDDGEQVAETRTASVDRAAMEAMAELLQELPGFRALMESKWQTGGQAEDSGMTEASGGPKRFAGGHGVGSRAEQS